MIYKIKKKNKPEIGEKRIKTIFTYLPKIINGKFIWLEKIEVEETYTQEGDCVAGYFRGWIITKLIQVF